MKDQFGNYVVQKVLETCDDRSLELILSRIKVHLNTLKKYTYGKHIVSRVEKLITTGGEEAELFPTEISVFFFFFLPGLVIILTTHDFNPFICRKAHRLVSIILFWRHRNIT